MMTFELTFLINTTDGSDIDLSELESVLSYCDSNDLELIELDLAEPDTAVAIFSTEANSIKECPRDLPILNDPEFVEDVNLYDAERTDYTSY